MARPKIKTALISIFFFIAAMFAASAYMSLTSLSKINASLEDFTGTNIPGISAAKNIQIERLYMRAAVSTHIMQQDVQAKKALEETIATQKQKLQTAIEAYSPFTASEADKATLKTLLDVLPNYFSVIEQILVQSRNGNIREAANMFFGDFSKFGAEISRKGDALIDFNQKKINDAAATAQSAYSKIMTVSLIIFGAAALVLIFASYFSVTSIARPIQIITSSMTQLASGDTAKAIPFDGRADEIGEMAGAVEVFRQGAIANMRLEDEAEANRLKAEADRVRLTAEAEAAAQKRLQEATSGLATGLRRLAGGDLGFQLTDAFAPDFEALRHDLNGAVGQLAETLRSVAQATHQIDSGSQEISRGADDLSRRTEQQAASLEETAAALDQITANVSNSSKRADEARAVAVHANASAVESGKVVARAVDAMEKIEQSSNEISNIIGVIDEIAFQTNLLALNAGVEAARAGDAGKGFAVVAQEVRELAQRSAKAAKEIKELIRNSSAEVQNGVKLVSETGQSLKTIEGYIVTVNQHMDSIAISAREQSVGLGEVNTAVNQMDQVTQQNAAMVEETSAAGAVLATESSRLRDLIGQFQLGDAGSQVAALHQAASTMAFQPTSRRVVKDTRPVVRGNTVVKHEEWAEF